jgi:hypothetical protein
LEEKPKKFMKPRSEPSEFEFVYSLKTEVLSKVEEMEANGRYIKQSGATQNNKLYTKNLRLMANFIIERLETDYLNIEKIKIEPKFRHNSSEPRYAASHAGTSSSSIAGRNKGKRKIMRRRGKWGHKKRNQERLPPCCQSSRASPTTVTPIEAITLRK